MRDQPERMRMPSMLFYAPPHMGKSAITWRCKHLHEEQLKISPDLPGVVRMQAPPTVDERRFYQALLEAMGVRAHSTRPSIGLTNCAWSIFAHVECAY